MSIKKIAKERPAPIDVTDLYLNFLDEYRNVFILQLEDSVMIYKAIGRKAYKDILTNDKLTDLQKEEVICRECLLYPDPGSFDWDNCDAGIPTQLRKAILKNSYLENMEDRETLKKYYRLEMYDLDNQITCVINEAFPNIDIEEIEQWDVEKTTKYYTRAEWKLQNLRNIQFASEEDDNYQLESMKPQSKKSKKNHRGKSKKEKLTPENIGKQKPKHLDKDKSGMTYEEFVAKFPEFANDTVMQNGDIEDFTYDTTAPALRTGL